jgi:hypothetical protein
MVDPHAVGELHLGLGLFNVICAVAEDAKRGVGAAATGAKEGKDLIERGASAPARSNVSAPCMEWRVGRQTARLPRRPPPHAIGIARDCQRRPRALVPAFRYAVASLLVITTYIKTPRFRAPPVMPRQRALFM